MRRVDQSRDTLALRGASWALSAAVHLLPVLLAGLVLAAPMQGLPQQPAAAIQIRWMQPPPPQPAGQFRRPPPEPDAPQAHQGDPTRTGERAGTCRCFDEDHWSDQWGYLHPCEHGAFCSAPFRTHDGWT